MAERVHIAVTRRVRKERVGDFERAFSELARRPLLELVKIAPRLALP